MDSAMNLDKDALAQFCKQHHIRRLSLFGSHLKGTGQSSATDLRTELCQKNILI